MKRRQFIKVAAATAGMAVAPSVAARLAAERGDLTEVSPVQAVPTDVERTWLGESFWANRLQDWRLTSGRFECLRNEPGLEVRSISLLTRFLTTRQAPARLSMTVGLIDRDKPGFCGFLLGVGKGELDYRGCALVHSRAGVNGGFMAVIDHEGELQFRDFSDQDKPLDFERLDRSDGLAGGPVGARDIHLDCHIDPTGDDVFDVRLVASDAKTGEELGFAVRPNVPSGELTGGLSLVSSPPPGEAGARWWISDVATGGRKISEHPERCLGPLIGCMHSLNGNVLKLTAQYLPRSDVEQRRSQLEFRLDGEKSWQHGPVAMIGDGYLAAFRIADWDPSRDWEYRVVDPDTGDGPQFEGRIARDPAGERELKVALYSCLIPVSKRIDDAEFASLNDRETVPGRFTPENILFPHADMVAYCDSQEPDLYVFCGDQYYESFPTGFGRDTPDALHDTLYRWYLWYWTFRESLRNRPAIVLADDHDILQGNVWGNGGVGSEKPTEEEGGYKWDKELVRTIFELQHAHNPDPADPTPIRFGIPVTFGEFVYGGVSFAIVEDRKWKTPPDYDSDPLATTGDLLGARQEAFVADWGQRDTGLPKVVLTASIWGVPQTAGERRPLLDYDANGYPPDGRTRAVRLVASAKALVLAGDQHLGMIAHQGVEDYDDGALFFAGPAAASFWQRWFEGEGKLDNQRNDDPNTGDFVDCFGNKMRVLAVANPRVSWTEFNEGQVDWRVSTSDRSIPSEGYGIVRISPKDRTALLECWPRDVDPETGAQFNGWPYLHRFDG